MRDTKSLKTEWLKVGFRGFPEAVDREAGILRGFVVAQEGPFKSRGRGVFDVESLRIIVNMANAAPKGLKSRFTHPTASDDGLGKFLGRVRDVRLGKAVDARTKELVSAVRGDLYFDPTAYKTPHGDLATYVMDLAQSDSDAMSSSLVLETDEVEQVDDRGKLKMGDDGEPLPPLWRPKQLHASDIVDTGDAVDGLLSAEDLAKALSVGLTPELQHVLHFDNVARLATQLLNGMFSGQPREIVSNRCHGWVDRYLEQYFGPPLLPPATPKLDALRKRLEENQLAVSKSQGANS